MKSLLPIITLFSCSLFGYSQSYTSYFTGNTTDMIVSPTPPGGICLMGGASEHDEAMKWFLTRAYSGDVLVIRASGSNGYNDYLYSQLGVNVNSVETIVFNNSSAAYDPYVHERISKAEAIWMAGGDQWNYVSYWRNTPIDSLINDAIANRGIVIGGTSAGMAVQGGFYFSAENGTVTSNSALQNPFNANVTVDSVSFIKNNYLQDVITDTHYDNPDRKGRHVVFLAHIFQNYGIEAKGIACNEYTAVCIDENGLARVYGDYPAYDEFAYFISKNCELSDIVTTPEVYSSGTPLTWDYSGTVLRAYKVPGTMNGTTTFNLADWETGTGGDWLYWSVNAGTFVESTASAPDCSASIQEVMADPFEIYPNPTDGKTVLQFSSEGKRSIQLFTAEGVKVLTETSTESQLSLDLSNCSQGVYFVSIQSDAGMTTQKLIKR